MLKNSGIVTKIDARSDQQDAIDKTVHRILFKDIMRRRNKSEDQSSKEQGDDGTQAAETDAPNSDEDAKLGYSKQQVRCVKVTIT